MKKQWISPSRLAIAACLFAAASAMAAPTWQATGMSGAVAGGTATSVFTLVPGYDLIALDLSIDYDPSRLDLSAADVSVDYDQVSYTLADFVGLLDGYNGSASALASFSSGPGYLTFSFLSALEVLPNPASMTFTSTFHVLPSLLPGDITTVDYTGGVFSDDPHPDYMGDSFALDAQISAPVAVPEPQSAALALAGLAALAALRRRHRPHR